MWNSLVGLLTNFINFLYGITVTLGAPSYGLAIIFFTIIVRVIMFPLSLRQARMTKNMQLVQPKMQQLQQQYKNSPEIMNREIMALYKKYNANPMSGCLPLLIQMPILIALFTSLRQFEYASLGSSFLWIDSLSAPDPIYLPILVAISSYVQSKLTLSAQPQAGTQAKTMNIMMLYAMPLWIGWLSRTFAAGLSVYWVTFNTIGAIQQVVMNAIVGRSHEEMKKAMEEEDRQAEMERTEKARQRAEQRQNEPKKVKKQIKVVKSSQSNSKNASKGKPLDI